MLGEVGFGVQQQHGLGHRPHDAGGGTTLDYRPARFLVGPAQPDMLAFPCMGTPHLPAQWSDPLALPSRSDDRITILRAFHTMRPPRHRPWPGSRATHEPPAGAVEYYPTARCAIGVAPVEPVIPRARSLEAKGVVDQVVDTVELRRHRPPDVEARMHRLQLRRSVQPLFKAVNAWEAEGRSQGNRRFCFGLNHRSFIQI